MDCIIGLRSMSTLNYRVRESSSLPQLRCCFHIGYYWLYHQRQRDGLMQPPHCLVLMLLLCAHKINIDKMLNGTYGYVGSA